MANLGYVQVTRLCNQGCRFCSNPPNRNSITSDAARALIAGFVREGLDGVILTGGEPTLYPGLEELIAYCAERSFHCRIITNGQRLADRRFAEMLAGAGLRHVGLSLYSVRSDVQAGLTQNPNSLPNIVRALRNLERIGTVTVDVTTVINKYNADHLSANVSFVLKNFPFVRHFVWNNLDPLMNRASVNTDTIPPLGDFEVELFRCAQLLDRHKRSYRIERVPLCYMPGFEHVSTETRKIVLGEKREIHFLDEKGRVVQTDFTYGKAECCRACSLDPICAGLYEMDRYYSSSELYPVFTDPEEVRARIRSSRDSRRASIEGS